MAPQHERQSAAGPETPALPAAAVHIALLSPEVLRTPVVRANALSLLSEEEIKRAEAFVFDADRDAFLATRALARVILGRYTRASPRRLEFVTSAAGKPELQAPLLEPRLRFNVSHTRTLVACAVVWDADVGVDVEALREVPTEIAERLFSPPEIEALRAMTPRQQQEGFLAFWTLKESFVKARGVGLSMPLNSFGVALEPPRLLPCGVVRDEVSRWHFARWSPTHVHRLAICVRTDGKTVPSLTTEWLSTERIIDAAGRA